MDCRGNLSSFSLTLSGRIIPLSSTKLLKSVRLKDWLKPKAGLILSQIFLAMILVELSPADSYRLLLPAIITLIGIGSFGHLVNDFFDMEYDKAGGKHNRLADLSGGQVGLLFAIVLAVAAIPWYFLPSNLFTWLFLSVEFLLMLSYAMPPLRVKSHRYLSVIWDALYAYVIPGLLSFYTFILAGGSLPDIELLIFFGGWLLISGVHNFLIHLSEDLEADHAAGSITLAVSMGNQKFDSIVQRAIFPLHLVLFLASWIYLAFIFHAKLILGPVLAVVFLIGLDGQTRMGLQRLNLHYHQFLPLFLSLLLTISDLWFLPLLLLSLIIFGKWLMDLVRGLISSAAQFLFSFFKP
jgi:hypothetical protein